MTRLIEEYFDRLFPIARSLTGDGVRESLKILQEIIDIEIKEVPSGTKALDWTIPKEWNVREAYIITPEGKRIADFFVNNLHLIGYSIPYEGFLSFEELAKHIITRADLPDAIPYATSYYNERWGFCLAYNDFLALPKEGMYYVKIDSKLENGSMTYGEAVLKGSSKYEIFFTSYICHPSLANNELSGPLAVSFLYREIKKIENRKYTYRFLLGPETIGAIYYLSIYGQHFKDYLKAGVVVTCCGDKGGFTLKESRSPSYANNLMNHLLRCKHKDKYNVQKFFPMGSDERQYCSPGFDLPVICFSRSIYGTYSQYHTSLDNKDIVDFRSLEDTINILKDFVKGFELENYYLNQYPFGEPQLGRRNLYPTLMSDLERSKSLERLLYLLNYSDGKHTLLEISDKMQELILNFDEELHKLKQAGLLKVLPG